MKEIKLNLFEGIVSCTIFPNIGYFFTTILLSFSLIVEQKNVVYNGIAISYIVCTLLMMVSLAICFIAIRKSKKSLILADTFMVVADKKYCYNQIKRAKYYVCKWYAIPIAFIYKQQQAGLVEIYVDNAKPIKLRVLYRDYLKIKSKINFIEEL